MKLKKKKKKKICCFFFKYFSPPEKKGVKCEKPGRTGKFWCKAKKKKSRRMPCQKRKCGKRMQRKHGRRAHSSVGSEQQEWGGGGREGGKAARGGHCTRFNTGHATLPHCPFHPLFSNFSLIIIGRENIAVTLVFPAILFSITHQV